MEKSKYLKIAIIFLAILTIFLTSYYARRDSTKDAVGDISKNPVDRVFFAKNDKSFLRLSVFNPSNNTIEYSREIDINPLELVSHYNEFYNQDSYIRFFPETYDVYFLVNGNTGYDCGEDGCTRPTCPPIGDCVQFVVYKINLKDLNSPSLVYEHRVDRSAVLQPRFNIPDLGFFGITDEDYANGKHSFLYQLVSPNGLYHYTNDYGPVLELFIKNGKKLQVPVTNYLVIWSKDSSKLIYIADKKSLSAGESYVRFIDTSTGKDEGLMSPDAKVQGLLGMSYSGRYIAFNRNVDNVLPNTGYQNQLAIYDLQSKNSLILPYPLTLGYDSGNSLIEWFQ
jgi:hypothetical protein